LTCTPKTVNAWANTHWPDAQPCMSLTLCVATCPATSLVTARLMPASMKNELSVIRKLGILVFITR
jgi:hypothetical protein